MNVDLIGDDDWDDYGQPRRRRPSPHHMRSDRSGMLDPRFGSSGLYRSRSHGQSVQPQINIYNRNQDEVRNVSPYPPGAFPPYPAAAPRQASPRHSPEGRSRGRSRLGDRLGEELEYELAGMALEHRYGRSRSRVRSDASTYERSPARAYEWQLAQREAELRERSKERSREKSHERLWKLEEERIKANLKLQALEAEMRKDRENETAREREKRLIADYERKQREAEENEKLKYAEIERKQREMQEKREADDKRAMAEIERRQSEAKAKAIAEEQRIKEKMARDAREAKEKKEREYREYKEQERKEKEEEERRYNEFLREQKEREEKEKQKAKEAEEKFQAEMRKRLASMGYTEKTIEVLVDQEKAKQFKQNVEKKQETQMDVFRSPRAPVYPKVHRDYLAVETLKYYDLPWEYDRSNPDYIIILRDMDKRETDVLFEHTTRLRSGKLLLEPAKKDKQFALYRRRSKSRSGAPKEIGVLRLR